MKNYLAIALASMMLITTGANADWIHSGPRNYGISMFSPLGIDINEDGITDVSFSFSFLITMDVPTSGGGGFASGSTLGNYVWAKDREAYPIRLLGTSPEEAAPDGAWWQGSFSIGSYGVNFLDGTWTGWQGLWAETDVGYIALLFRDASNALRMAWVRFLVPDDLPMPMPIVMDWFYESEPVAEPSVSEITLLPEGDLRLSLSSDQKGLQYILEGTTNLNSGVWTTSRIINTASGPIDITNAFLSPKGFWRIKRAQ